MHASSRPLEKSAIGAVGVGFLNRRLKKASSTHSNRAEGRATPMSARRREGESFGRFGERLELVHFFHNHHDLNLLYHYFQHQFFQHLLHLVHQHLLLLPDQHD